MGMLVAFSSRLVGHDLSVVTDTLAHLRDLG